MRVEKRRKRVQTLKKLQQKTKKSLHRTFRVAVQKNSFHLYAVIDLISLTIFCKKIERERKRKENINTRIGYFGFGAPEAKE